MLQLELAVRVRGCGYAAELQVSDQRWESREIDMNALLTWPCVSKQADRACYRKLEMLRLVGATAQATGSMGRRAAALAGSRQLRHQHAAVADAQAGPGFLCAARNASGAAKHSSAGAAAAAA